CLSEAGPKNNDHHPARRSLAPRCNGCYTEARKRSTRLGRVMVVVRDLPGLAGLNLQFRRTCARLAVLRCGSAWNSNEGAAFQRCYFRESHIGHLAWESCEREIFSQREERITVPHQNTTEVWVTVEFDSHHVVNLPLVPIRGWPNVGNGVHSAGVLRNF